MREPDNFLLAPSDPVPNNPRLPVLVYRAVLPPGTADPAGGFEALFANNGWPAQWRNGVYPFHHYHPDAHEVLGIAAGGTEVVLGGPGGRRLAVAAGDVLVLPAGTGHCNLSPEAPLLVVGAYPPGTNWTTRRDPLPAAAWDALQHAPFPNSDPVAGVSGALPRLWRDGTSAAKRMT